MGVGARRSDWADDRGGGKEQADMRRTGSEDEHVQALLGVFLLGGLSAHEEAAVRRHLDACARCRAESDYLACVPKWLDLVREDVDDDSQLSHGPAERAPRPDPFRGDLESARKPA